MAQTSSRVLWKVHHHQIHPLDWAKAHQEEHQPQCNQEQESADQPEEGYQWDWEDRLQVLEGQHHRVGLEDFRQVAFLVDHPQVLEEEDRQEERHQGFNHPRVLVVHPEDLLLAFSRLQDSKGRLVRAEGFHHQVLEGDDHRLQQEVAPLKKHEPMQSLRSQLTL